VIPFEHPGKLHRLRDPEVGDDLLVMTGVAPVRGFLRRQDFVELDVLPSRQGVVIKPIADDVAAKVGDDNVTFSRPGGLALSAAVGSQEESAASFSASTFNSQIWNLNRRGNYYQRESNLIRVAAAAPPGKRKLARLNLARFYLAHRMSAEAMGVLNVVYHGDSGDVTGSVLKSVANIMLDRPKDALKDLSHPQVGNQLDAPIWRAIAYAREDRWPEAHKLFRDVEIAVAALPLELQRMALLEALRAAVEVRDFGQAERLVHVCQGIGVAPKMKPAFEVLIGRLDQALGRNDDALNEFHEAAEANAGPATAEGKLREIELRYRLGQLTAKETVVDLETLTTIWRGDATEAEGLRLLAHLYTEEGRYRDAFHVMRVALLAHPNSDLTHKIQDEAAATFESLFLTHKGDSLPPIEALALFYDYRELTPIGRRGDEMIRRLADRLVAVDLLGQAAKLLQHQVDYRLQGAARAQVATRLAVIYLMDHKPDRALATLQSTRAAQLNNELRDQRLLLQARALSDLGRYDLALEVIEDIKSKQAMRLRADILWAAHRWREAAEQIERLYGNRWRDFRPLNARERFDILRAAIGYALADEPLSLQRFREKYAAKMESGPDGHAFDVVSAPIGTGNAEFRAVATRVASLDTLDAFLSDMRKRYPDSSAISTQGADDKGAPQVSAPQTVPPSEAGVGLGANAPKPPNAPQGPQQPSDKPTGSIRSR
ncbi:MAG TPA: tetratricopeptide repeat protein, partial [Pseudolabrys sp.]|nr:tetratricopeptide repeat protein [Pseudolabrys sp.]